MIDPMPDAWTGTSQDSRSFDPEGPQPETYVLDSRRRAAIRRNGAPLRPGSGCYPMRDSRQGANTSASLPATISPVASRPTTGAIATPACMTAR